MKLKNEFLYIRTLSLLSMISLNSYAAVNSFSLNNDVDEKAQIDEKKFIENMSKNLNVEENFVQGGMNYTLYKGLRAFIGKETTKEFANNRTSLKNSFQDLNVKAPKTILLDKGVFKIFFDSNALRSSKNLPDKHSSIEANSFNDSTSQENEVNKSSYKVAFNNQTKKFGVITGNAIIEIEPDKSIKIPNEGFKLMKSYKQLGLYVVKVPENMKYKDALDKLKLLNPNSQSASEEKSAHVNIEVLENFKTAM